MNQIINNLANILTISRVLFLPILVVSFYIPFTWARWMAVVVFIIASITDFLDGFIARRWQQVSRFGQFLDPVADKLLVAVTLLMLAGFDRIHRFSLWAAVVILSREILVSGLREYLSSVSVSIPVSNTAKFKTFIQLLSISLLLLGDTQFFHISVMWLGELFLWCAAILTLATGYTYCRSTIHFFDSH